MVMFYNCFQQYKHNYVTGINNITVTSLEPNLSQIPSYLFWLVGVLSNHHIQLHPT